MALNPSEMKAKFQARITAGLQRVYSQEVNQGAGYSGISQQQWTLLADAISDIAIDIVTEMQTNAEVLQGQQVVTVGGPTNQTGATISNGKII